MKVLLVKPPAPNKLSFTKVLDNEPLELEYLHTVLMENGHEDYIYDGLVERISIKQTIIREKPQIIAISGYITQENLMKKYAEIAKDINPQITTIIGGVHAQRNYERFYTDKIDYILRSESLKAFIELVNFIDKAQGNLENINGLCYKNNEDKYIVNELKPSCINELPIPDRTYFYKHKSNYRYLDLTEIATVKTSFSCPYNCNFCYCTLLGGGKYSARDINLVIEEIKNIDCENIQIVDDDFLVDKNRIWEFIRLIKENNIKKTYICYARADFVSENYEIIKALKEIGFRYFLVGIEAVDDSQLQDYNKQTSVDINKKCVQVIEEAGAYCIALMIVGIDAKKEDFNNIYNWVVKNNVKYVTVSIFTPIPGTPLYEEYKDRLITNNIEDWDFLHLVLEPTNLSKSQFYKEYYNLFIKLYKIAKDTGIYDFMDLEFYKNLLFDYLKRKISEI